MEINCWELKNGKEIPGPSTTTLNGFEWNARFRMTVSNDDGSLGLPFIFAADDTAILTVEKSEQEGKRTGNKKIKQVISCVPRSLGTEIVCSRTRSYDGNEHVWSAWEITSANSGVDVEWDMNADINTYVTEGIFNITGERLSAADGLPIENSAPGHTIHARLTVLDSSITGSGDNDDKCITQILALSNRTGGDGDVYIRTGRASMKNMLAGGSGWEPWGKLQQNVQVGQVTSLDGFTGNGMYSGVYTDGTLFETFVMVVINNYAVAGATGNVRCISQFKYALNVNSNFSYKTRTGRGGSTVEWGSWVDLGAATTTDIQDNSITVQKLSTALQEQINKSANGAYWTSGPNAVTLNINKNDGTIGLQTLPVATEENAGVMTAEDKIKLNSATILKHSYNNIPIVSRIVNPISIIDVTPDMRSWVNNDTAGSVADRLVDVYDEIYQTKRQCIELTSTDRGRFYTPLSGSVDFTSNVLRGSLCIQKDYPTENLGVLEVELHSNNSINSSNRATFTIQYGNLADAEYNSLFVRGGWFHFCVNPDALISAVNRGANFDITNVTHVGIHPYHTTGIPLKVYIGDFSVVKKLLKPGVVTIVDNFNPSVPAMADYAFSKGVKLSLSIVPHWIEKGSGSATLEEINRIKRQGHFIFNHTYDHITNTSDMTELQIVEEITKGAEWMKENGFNRGKFVVSNPSAMFPFAKYKAYMESPLQMLYHHWITCPADSSKGILLYYPYYPMSRLLNISSLDKCDDAILIARKAKEKGGIAVNGYHGTFWSADGGTQWKKYIDAIAELDVKHYGIDELIEGGAV